MADLRRTERRTELIRRPYLGSPNTLPNLPAEEYIGLPVERPDVDGGPVVSFGVGKELARGRPKNRQYVGLISRTPVLVNKPDFRNLVFLLLGYGTYLRLRTELLYQTTQSSGSLSQILYEG